MDNNCAIGLGGMFYTRKLEGRTVVLTWLGTEVSRDVLMQGSVISFRRKAMTFRGRLRKDQDCFRFKRIQ